MPLRDSGSPAEPWDARPGLYLAYSLRSAQGVGEIPDSVFVNGCTPRLDGRTLLVCESVTGRILAIDQTEKRSSVWLRDDRLRPKSDGCARTIPPSTNPEPPISRRISPEPSCDFIPMTSARRSLDRMKVPSAVPLAHLDVERRIANRST